MHIFTTSCIDTRFARAALLLANLHLIPFQSPVYNTITSTLVPLSIPLLLFDSNISRIISSTGSLLKAFFVGTFSTLLATVISYRLVPMRQLKHESWAVASALASRHIGGAINFVAVAETFNISPQTVAAAIAADNVVVALYFIFLFAIAKSGADDVVNADDAAIPPATALTLESLSLSLTISSILVFLGKQLTSRIMPSFSALPFISLLTVLGATALPRVFEPLATSASVLGVIFVQLFFATAGAGGSIAAVISTSPTLFAFSALQIALHFAFLMAGGRALKLPYRELFLASNANVGGPTTAAAMAKGKKWDKLVLPALMVGIAGYAFGTLAGVGLGLSVLSKM